MKVLITGGAGFIGSHLTECLIGQGHSVAVLDDLSTGSLDNLSALLKHPGLRIIEGTILDRRLVRTQVSDCDQVVHLASAVGVYTILEKPLSSLQTNVDGTDSVLSACAEFRRPVLLASTSETYGKNSADSLCEDADSILGPSSAGRWSYATAKKLDEFLGLAYHATHGVPATITRFFNIAGPRQSARYGMVLPAFVRAALAGQPIRVFGDGAQSRNFTYIDDCIDALLRLLGNPAAIGNIVNIGSEEEISIHALAKRVKHAAGSSSPITFVPYDEAYPGGGFEDMRRRVPCICRIRALTGWWPSTDLATIIQKTILFERGRKQAPVPAPATLLSGRHTQTARSFGGLRLPSGR
jgi:UDP-glucose 4-epimerase